LDFSEPRHRLFHGEKFPATRMAIDSGAASNTSHDNRRSPQAHYRATSNGVPVVRSRRTFFSTSGKPSGGQNLSLLGDTSLSIVGVLARPGSGAPQRRARQRAEQTRGCEPRWPWRRQLPSLSSNPAGNTGRCGAMTRVTVPYIYRGRRRVRTEEVGVESWFSARIAASVAAVRYGGSAGFARKRVLRSGPTWRR
jgi:hypothetical protein